MGTVEICPHLLLAVSNPRGRLLQPHRSLVPTWFEKVPPGLRKAWHGNVRATYYLRDPLSTNLLSVKKEALLVCTWLVPSAQSGGHSGDSKVCSHSIYIRTVSSCKRLLHICFAELVITGLWTVWEEQHAQNTRFLPRPARIRIESNVPKLKYS